MAEFKLKEYMPGPLGKQMIFSQTSDLHFSGYISNNKKRIKVRSPLEPVGKNGVFGLLVEEGRVSDEDLNTIFKSE